MFFPLFLLVGFNVRLGVKSVFMTVETTQTISAIATMEIVEEVKVVTERVRVPQRPPKVLLDQKKEEFDAKVKWFQHAIECENNYLAQLEQHIAVLMSDHQHHFIQRHMLLSKLSTMVSPMVEYVENVENIENIENVEAEEDYFIPEQIEFDDD